MHQLAEDETGEKERLKATVKASMLLAGKSKLEIDFALKKIDDEFELRKRPKKPPEEELGETAADDFEPAPIMLPAAHRRSGLPRKFMEVSRKPALRMPIAPERRHRKDQRRDFKRDARMQDNRAPVLKPHINGKPSNSIAYPKLVQVQMGTNMRGGLVSSGLSGGKGMGGGPAGPGGGPR